MIKKYFKLVLVLFLLFIVAGCSDKSQEPADQLTIYTINDFHGAITETDGAYGIARLGEYMINAKKEAPNETILLAAGDMFQGTGLSYYSQGEDVVELMNMIEFDAMAIGNHEFDWTLDTILEYRDENKKNGEADFPFLGANIIQKSKNDLPNYVDPYTIIERGGLKIGIIGYIGYGLEDDIATQMIADYEFLMPVDVVGEYASILRNEENCEVIIALGHDGSDATNSSLAALTGDERIDAIVNGHLHENSATMISTLDGRKVPVVQAGSSGEYVGVINFEVDQVNKTLSNPSVLTVEMTSSRPQNNSLVKYVNKLEKETVPFFGRVIGTAATKITVYDVRQWGPNILQKEMNVDIAFANSGGIRADAFPIDESEDITIAKLYQIMPFDNLIKTCKLLGSDIKKLLNASGLVASESFVRNGSEIIINGKTLIDDEYYSVAAIDYIFDKTEYPFLKGIDITNDGKLYRDLMIEVIEKLTMDNQKWNPKE